MVSKDWQLYLEWNSAICKTVFTTANAGSPVYLDMDDAVLAQVALHMATPPEEAAGELAKVVQSTLLLDEPHTDVFRLHRRQLHEWRRSIRSSDSRTTAIEPPPVIGLLAVFTLAAEAMGSNTSFAVNAYYPRLGEILGVRTEKTAERLHTAYRSAAEQLWRGLNDWLTVTEGRYGVPTAYALTHRYVGLPLSQALVRAADRKHLAHMFRQFGLPAGSNLPPGDVARMLDVWMQQTPSPASSNLRGLWARPGAQERIAEVVAAELLNWDAAPESPSAATGRRSGDARLMAQFGRFPRPALQLSFLVAFPTDSPPEEVEVLSAEGRPSVDVLPFAGSAVRPRSAVSIETRSMVEGVLRIGDPRTDAVATRHPRRVVTLRRDERTAAFVECERVQLGEDFLLLVKDHGQLPRSVEGLLKEIARPGYRTYREVKGLPPGWVLVVDVQVLCTPAEGSRHPDLNPLVPLSSSQLNLASGLKLPGNLRKWSSLRPPQIRAVSQHDHELVLTLTATRLDSDDTDEPLEWTSSQGVLLVDLDGQELADGDYELELNTGARAIQRAILRMRSSDTPDRWSWEMAPRLGYDLATPLGALNASRVAPTALTAVRGALSPRAESRSRGPAEVGQIWWSHGSTHDSEVPPIVIDSPDPTSCVVTGAHKILLPTAVGRPTSPMMDGSCEHCGLVKRYPTWFSNKGRQDPLRSPIDRPQRLADLAEVDQLDISRDHAFDALVHVGGGSMSAFTRIASQVQHAGSPGSQSAMASDSFRGDLEALGHVEVERDERSEAVAWAVAPPCLSEASDGSFFLTGAWSRAAQDRLHDAVDEAGGKFSYSNDRPGPTTWFVEQLELEQLLGLVPALDLDELLPGGRAPEIVPKAAMALVDVLPPLSAVERNLTRVPLPGGRMVERFDVPSASWRPVQAAEAAGAYRFTAGFRRSYCFRSEADLDQREVAMGSPLLVKHLEAHRTGRLLLAYYQSRQHMAAPRGAALPGLYGRAAVLNSGRLPGTSKTTRSHVYHDVPESFASRMSQLLSS